MYNVKRIAIFQRISIICLHQTLPAGEYNTDKTMIEQLTPCLKKRPPLACYNFDAHEWILIFFGRNVTDKVGNQKTLYYATSNNSFLHYLAKCGNTKITHFTQLDCVTHTQCTCVLVACEHHLTSRDTHLLCAGREIVWHERCRFAQFDLTEIFSVAIVWYRRKAKGTGSQGFRLDVYTFSSL